MPLPLVHARLANTALMYVFALGMWALWRAFRKQPLDSGYWGALVIAELLLGLQGLLGVLLWLGGNLPARGGMHILYGTVALLTFPGLFAYTRGENSPQIARLYGLVSLFLTAILFRAMVTGA